MPPGPGCRATNAWRGPRVPAAGGSARLLSLTRVGNPPYGTAGVFRNQERPVPVDRDADRAAPDLRIVDREAGGEILVFAGRRAVLHRYTDDLVAGAFGAIPRAVLGGENIAAVRGRELRGVIERHAQRRRMSLDQHVRDGDLVLQIRPLAGMTRVLVRADIIPGPAVIGAVAHAGDVIGRHIVAEAVALVGRAPQRAARGCDRHADAVADAGGEDAAVLAVRIEGQDIGALGLVAPCRAERMIGLPRLQRRRAQLL